MTAEQYQKFEFTGYVYKIRDSKWGKEISLKGLADETEEKYPQHILVNVSKKREGEVDPNLGIGDKVKVVILPTLTEGVSDKTQKAYAINKLNLQKMDVLERAQQSENDNGDDGSDEADDIPF